MNMQKINENILRNFCHTNSKNFLRKNFEKNLEKSYENF